MGKKYFCNDCYKKEFPLSIYKKKIWLVYQKMFDLYEYKDIPKYLSLQIDKYIYNYNLTEQGIFNTLSYIYLTCDFDKFNEKYGLYPVLKYYDLHKNFKLKKQKLNKVTENVVHTSLQPSRNKVKKIDELRLNENE